MAKRNIIILVLCGCFLMLGIDDPLLIRINSPCQLPAQGLLERTYLSVTHFAGSIDGQLFVELLVSFLSTKHEKSHFMGRDALYLSLRQPVSCSKNWLWMLPLFIQMQVLANVLLVAKPISTFTILVNCAICSMLLLFYASCQYNGQLFICMQLFACW